MKVIIAGSRDLSVPSHEIDRCLSIAGYAPTEIVSGAARGIDRCGEIWAQDHQIKVSRFSADWAALGKIAGPVRNRHMAEYGDALLAFPGTGRGTWDMIEKMAWRGKPAFVWSLQYGRPIERHEWSIRQPQRTERAEA